MFKRYNKKGAKFCQIELLLAINESDDCSYQT